MAERATLSSLDEIPRSDTSLADLVLDAVATAILEGRLKPDTLYSVQQLAKAFGMSRTPVREALVRLADAGVVRFERNRGIQVLNPEPEEVKEVFQLRLMLEVPAVYYAAQSDDPELLRHLKEDLDGMALAAENDKFDSFVRYDLDFHGRILQASGNKRLVRIVSNLRVAITFRNVLRPERFRDLYAFLTEHVEIFEALEAKNPRSAARCMHQHVKSVGTTVLKTVEGERFDPEWWRGVAEP